MGVWEIFRRAMADIGATRGKLSITPWQAFQRQGAGSDDSHTRHDDGLTVQPQGNRA